LLGQLQDPGRGRHNPGIGAYAIGASALPDDLSWTVPHALTTGEIHSMIEDFAASSARLERCGFSGVEISGGHGHLFHQFLSPWSNGVPAAMAAIGKGARDSCVNSSRRSTRHAAASS
jgi:2,4-dienoyl-CoA reductase-like NADH-dependent reductase (Old Yellow Enzyme family)